MMIKTEKTIGVIVGAGDFTARGLDAADSFVIAADGGLAHLEGLGIRPDLRIGDFDSLGYVPKGDHVIVLPVEKDDTDMAAAVSIARDLGLRDLRIYGGSGTRPDHFLANLQLMASCSRDGVTIRMEAPEFTLYALTNGSLDLFAQAGTTFSVFSHTDVTKNVTIGGDVKYPVRGIDLRNIRAVGVSNLLTGEHAKISASDGTLLVFLYHIPVS